jgi:hypothetical protein
VRRQRKVIDGCFAVDIMRDCCIVKAAPQLSELERFALFGSDAQAPLRYSFILKRYARFDVGEEGSRWGLADRQQMRFRRAFDECGKYRGRD